MFTSPDLFTTSNIDSITIILNFILTSMFPELDPDLATSNWKLTMNKSEHNDLDIELILASTSTWKLTPGNRPRYCRRTRSLALTFTLNLIPWNRHRICLDCDQTYTLTFILTSIYLEVDLELRDLDLYLQVDLEQVRARWPWPGLDFDHESILALTLTSTWKLTPGKRPKICRRASTFASAVKNSMYAFWNT